MMIKSETLGEKGALHGAARDTEWRFSSSKPKLKFPALGHSKRTQMVHDCVPMYMCTSILHFATSLEEEQHAKFYIFYSLFPLAIKCIIKMDILVEYITSTVRCPI